MAKRAKRTSRTSSRHRVIQVFNPAGGLALINGAARQRHRRKHHKEKQNPIHLSEEMVKRSRRRRVRRRENPSLRDIGEILKQAGLGAGGALVTNTVSAILPYKPASPLLQVGVKGAAGIGVGILGGRLFGRDAGDAIMAGGLIAAAVDLFYLLFPGLGQPGTFMLPLNIQQARQAQQQQQAQQQGQGQGQSLSGLVDWTGEGDMVLADDADLEGLVNIPKGSPLESNPYYY